ncbi:hypothetical protein OHB15_23380 [Streptosporangium subroseum]|nr:hypothetical protein OHB15_23380 [Streptosporangium subroseum]
MTTDLDTLVTAPYVKIDDKIGGTRLGRPPLLGASELACLAVAFHRATRRVRR